MLSNNAILRACFAEASDFVFRGLVRRESYRLVLDGLTLWLQLVQRWQSCGGQFRWGFSV